MLKTLKPNPITQVKINYPQFNSLVVFPDIWMMHLLSIPVSLELKGRTLTATLTEAPAMSTVGVRMCRRAGDQKTGQKPAKVSEKN